MTRRSAGFVHGTVTPAGTGLGLKVVSSVTIEPDRNRGHVSSTNNAITQKITARVALGESAFIDGILNCYGIVA